MGIDLDQKEIHDEPRRSWTPVLLLLAIVPAWTSTNRLDGGEPNRPAPLLRIDPNTVPLRVFSALPRLGPTHLAAIETARRQKPFRSLKDFDARVKGVGPSTIRAIQPHLVFDPTD